MVSDWKRSIVRSCRGKGIYLFEGKVFDDDIARFKLEVLLVNPVPQVSKPVLTIIYKDNIDDELFTVGVGVNKPSSTIIENIKPSRFTLRLVNPNKSPLTVSLQLPILPPVESNYLVQQTQAGSASHYHHQLATHNHHMSIGYPAQPTNTSSQSNAVDNVSTITPPSTAAGTATVAGTSFQLLAANTNRARGSRIDNATNRDFYISFNSSTVPTPSPQFNLLPRSTTIAGTVEVGYLDIPDGYLGAIVAVANFSGSPISGNIYCHEMIYQ